MAEMTPEMKAQLEAQKAQCPFCKIIGGEIPAQKVYEDDKILAILDINPWIKGHMLVLPKEHYPIMPFLPPETFKHMFGVMAKLVGAAKKAMLCTGADVFIANGGIAGQQSPHFLVHILPREKGDPIWDKYLFAEDKPIEAEKAQQIFEAMKKNLPMMLGNHFSRTPASWHTGAIQTAEHLSDKQLLYSDEKAAVAIPEHQQSLGHMVVYSQEEASDLENLDEESSSHLFYVASYCATAVFEGLGAQGSNIILKSGTSDDNPDGRLCVHILPRFQDDGMDVLPKPLAEKPNMDQIAAKIKEETWIIENAPKESKKKEPVVLDKPVPVLVADAPVEEKPGEPASFDSAADEIMFHIRKRKG
jgi:histidine triad (HIT) family protein